jgi:hypothetical protein
MRDQMRRTEKPAEARREMLAEGAVVVGEKWAENWREDLRKEGRPVSGGWPGTLPEARARVTAYFGQELARKRLPVLTADELGWAARATYERAKRDWLGKAIPTRKR